MADGAMVVADDLHFDVAGVADPALDIDAVAAEGRLGLGLAARIGLLQLGGVIDDAHAASATAGDGLDHHCAAGAQRCKEGLGLFEAGRPAGAFDHGHAAFSSPAPWPAPCRRTVQRLRRRPDEDDAFLDAAPGECGILAEEAIAGVQRIAAGRLRSRDHGFDVQIGPRAPPRDLVSGIGGAGMHRLRIVGGIDRDRGEPDVTAARAMRMAISPRLAISNLWKDMDVSVRIGALRHYFFPAQKKLPPPFQFLDVEHETLLAMLMQVEFCSAKRKSQEREALGFCLDAFSSRDRIRIRAEASPNGNPDWLRTSFAATPKAAARALKAGELS